MLFKYVGISRLFGIKKFLVNKNLIYKKEIIFFRLTIVKNTNFFLDLLRKMEMTFLPFTRWLFFIHY